MDKLKLETKLKRKNLKRKKSEMQFKFLFSMIFSVFLFIFVFGFMTQMFFTYQQYAIVSLYTTLMAFLDIVYLKKDTSSFIEITKGSNFEIKFTDNEMKIKVFFKQQNFPLYNKIVFAPLIDTGSIYYDVKTINLPFYVDSIIYLIPTRTISIFNSGYKDYLLFTYTNSYTYKDIKDLTTYFFPNEITNNLPFSYGKLSSFLSSHKNIDNLRVLIYCKSLLDGLLYLKQNLNKIKENDYNYWIVFAVPVNDYTFKLYMLEKPLTKDELIKLINAKMVSSSTYKEIYIPKDLLLGSLLVDNRQEFINRLKKLINQIYYSYLAYSKANEQLSLLGCEKYNEINEIINKIKEVKEKNSGYLNLSLFIGEKAQEIAKRNNEKLQSDTPICTLY